jgi:uncharacterized protein (UPF0261 family)
MTSAAVVLRPEIEVIEVEAHINHPLFAETMVEVLDRLMQRESSESSAG